MESAAGALTKAQNKILQTIANFPGKKYLLFTGGTALSRVYLQHRVSEDLDFLFKADNPIKFAQVFTQAWQQPGGCRITNADLDGLEFSFVANIPGLCPVKVELINKPYRVDSVLNASPFLWHGISAESIAGICLGKMEALVGRKDVKDIIDLLAIFHAHPSIFQEVLAECKQFSWSLDTDTVLAEFQKRPLQPETEIHLLQGWSWDLLMQAQQDLYAAFFSHKQKWHNVRNTPTM